MRRIAPETFQEMIEAGHETRNVEFKASFAWGEKASIWMQEKVIRAMLGMANTRDGGTIVIGIAETKGGIPDLASGVDVTHLPSFERYDAIKGNVDRFGSNVSFDLAAAEYNGETFVVISVQEFPRLPIICKDDGVDHSGRRILQKGDVYVRSLAGTDGTIRASDVEMIDIIEMAVDKNQRSLHDRGWRHATDGTGGFAKERGDF